LESTECDKDWGGGPEVALPVLCLLWGLALVADTRYTRGCSLAPVVLWGAGWTLSLLATDPLTNTAVTNPITNTAVTDTVTDTAVTGDITSSIVTDTDFLPLATVIKAGTVVTVSSTVLTVVEFCAREQRHFVPCGQQQHGCSPRTRSN